MFSPLHAYLHDYDVMYSSVYFLHPFPPSCCQELKYVKETANKALADLEAVAHAHASRAQRLADEMAYLRAQYLEVKRQLDSSKQLQERDHELGETLRELKSDLAFVSLCVRGAQYFMCIRTASFRCHSCVIVAYLKCIHHVHVSRLVG